MEFNIPSSLSTKSCFMCGLNFDRKTVHPQSSGVKGNQLVKFICELERFFYNCNTNCANDQINNDLNRWNHLKTKSVCEECAVISQFALKRKENVIRTEQTVRQLQSKLEKEMKFLESQLSRFLKEIKSIEEKMKVPAHMAVNEEMQMTEKEKVGQAVWRVIQAFKTGSGEEIDIKFAIPSSPPSSAMFEPVKVKVENYFNEATCLEVVMKEDQDHDDNANHDNDDNMALNENATQPEMSDSDHDDQYLPESDETDDDDDDDQSSNDGNDPDINISSDEEESDQSSKQKSKTKKVKSATSAKPKILQDSSDVLEGIDTSHMSDFKISVIRRVLQTARRRRAGIRTAYRPSKQLDSHHVANPGLNYTLDYSPEKDELFLENTNILIVEDPQGLQCSQCPYFSKRRSKIIKKNRSQEFFMDHFMFEHILSKHLKVYQCPFCDVASSCYKNYKLHINKHKKIHKCDICGKPMGNKKTLKSHKWTHMSHEEIAEAERNGEKDPRLKNKPPLMSKRSFQCSICGKSFTQKGNLKKHEIQVHEGKGESKIVFCPKCGKRMSERTFRYYHKECLDPISAIPVKCLHCSGTFKNLRLMRMHCRKYHNSSGDEETWKCGVCGKEFRFKEGLRNHEILHSGVKPYECGKGCRRKFAQRNSCKRHNRVCEGFGTKPGRKR